MAYASEGVEEVVMAIRSVYPDADPTEEELFGLSLSDFPFPVSPDIRGRQFRAHLPDNPWNNGEKGILCLTQQFNTRAALFNLVSTCSIHRDSGHPDDTCGAVGGACGAGRASDPVVCSLSQQARRGGLAVSFPDPPGIAISKLEGVWKMDGNPIDINDDSDGTNAPWQISRGGRRASLRDVGRLLLDNEPISTGSQVARVLEVVADVVAAQEKHLPVWARTGSEEMGLRS